MVSLDLRSKPLPYRMPTTSNLIEGCWTSWCSTLSLARTGGRGRRVVVGIQGTDATTKISRKTFLPSDRRSMYAAFNTPRSPCFAAQKLTEKVDVYALAMVYYCMLAGHSPYKNVKNATGMIENGIPPPTDPSWHAGFIEVGRGGG